jgi:hypothetical protein
MSVLGGTAGQNISSFLGPLVDVELDVQLKLLRMIVVVLARFS